MHSTRGDSCSAMLGNTQLATHPGSPRTCMTPEWWGFSRGLYSSESSECSHCSHRSQIANATRLASCVGDSRARGCTRDRASPDRHLQLLLYCINWCSKVLRLYSPSTHVAARCSPWRLRAPVGLSPLTVHRVVVVVVGDDQSFVCRAAQRRRLCSISSPGDMEAKTAIAVFCTESFRFTRSRFFYKYLAPRHRRVIATSVFSKGYRPRARRF